MNSQFIIFDADGVLIDSMAKACNVFNQLVLERYPRLPTISNQEDMAYVYPGPLRTSFRRFGLDDRDIADFFDRHSACMLREADDLQPFEAVIKAIAQTVGGRCAIVTSSYTETVRLVLSKSPSYDSRMFRRIMGRESRQTKSDKIRKLISEIGMSPHEAIYIGDMVSDILYCKELPIPVAGVGYGYQPASYLAAFAPNYLLPEQKDLASFLRSLQSPRLAASKRKTLTNKCVI